MILKEPLIGLKAVVDIETGPARILFEYTSKRFLYQDGVKLIQAQAGFHPQSFGFEEFTRTTREDGGFLYTWNCALNPKGKLIR